MESVVTLNFHTAVCHNKPTLLLKGFLLWKNLSKVLEHKEAHITGTSPCSCNTNYYSSSRTARNLTFLIFLILSPLFCIYTLTIESSAIPSVLVFSRKPAHPISIPSDKLATKSAIGNKGIFLVQENTPSG